ncbi:hypothetical protein IM40_04670 [Candidatus Paracaedimonas acanthamoebae]|nr:hypothetical protein IM40_04670 [Candidatus Paracaedimonas acanthamoebae]
MREPKEETTSAESLQKGNKSPPWQQIFNRWWNLTFDQEGRPHSLMSFPPGGDPGKDERHRMATGEIFRSLGILGTGPRMTKLGTEVLVGKGKGGSIKASDQSFVTPDPILLSSPGLSRGSQATW